MFTTFPQDIHLLMAWTWNQFKPYADDLLARPLTRENVGTWLTDWSTLASVIAEANNRLEIRTTTHTTDEEGQKRYSEYAENVIPLARVFDQQMKEKLLASGLEPAGFEIPLRRMRAEAALFRAENLPLRTEIEKLGIERSKITGAWAIEWQGAELTFSEAVARLQDPDRSTREQVWRRLTARIMQDREKLDDLWVKLFDLRAQIAHNAGFKNYREYRWQELARFDYTPADCHAFHRAIEDVVVPAASRLNARRKARMGVDTLRVWDNFWFMSPDPQGRPPLAPFETLDQLNDTLERMFLRVDPQLGKYYRIMRANNLLDLESRKHKAGGAYMTDMPFTRAPFIFANAVNSHDTVITVLHESGHAFHGFEANTQPYYQQRVLEFVPMEFVEVGSMAMELLAAPYLSTDKGGFYSQADATRAIVEHLEKIIGFWPYMSVVDSFQHWVYENPELGRDPRQCDAMWSAIHRRYLPDLDWTGVEDSLALYWHIQGHIMSSPFYYIEYGLAQLGAVQVWARARQNQAQAVADYRRALAKGNTATLPQLYETAGVKLAFGGDTLRQAVTLIEQVINELDPM
jgi:oligoendopeptidase F